MTGKFHSSNDSFIAQIEGAKLGSNEDGFWLWMRNLQLQRSGGNIDIQSAVSDG